MYHRFYMSRAHGQIKSTSADSRVKKAGTPNESSPNAFAQTMSVDENKIHFDELLLKGAVKPQHECSFLYR